MTETESSRTVPSPKLTCWLVALKNRYQNPKHIPRQKDSLKTFLLKLPVILLAYYVLFGLVLISPLYYAIVYPGDPLDFVKMPSTKNDVFFPAVDGSRIHAWLMRSSGSNDLIILSHGNYGDLSCRKDLIDRLNKEGFNVLAYDYRGCGRSGGRTSLDGITADGLSAYDTAVAQLGFKPANIILCGESLGTGVSCQIAQQHECKALILFSPFTSLADIARKGFFCIYPEALVPQPHLNSLAVISKFSKPVLIVHGAKDSLIPLKQAERLAAASTNAKFVILPNSSHAEINPADSSMLDKVLQPFLLQIRSSQASIPEQTLNAALKAM